MKLLRLSAKLLLICCISWVFLFSCISKQEISVLNYYDYDYDLPLDDSVKLIADGKGYQMYSTSFTSVHGKRVAGLLSVPDNIERPVPVVILLHGLGDRKTVDYIEAGHDLLLKSGYAVMRIDIDNHGDRKVVDYEFDLTDGYRYWTRDLVTQTVFDLRRTIDFLKTRPETDSERIGFFGISLGGIIGTIFCGTDERVKVPVIALAGGNLNLMFGLDAFKEDTKEFFSIIDPINYVKEISPRPLLMINSENDEIVNPLTSKLLFNEADEPKEIIWYPSKHRDLPIDQAYAAGIAWFDKYL
jgi:uncharacterized protein